MNIKQAQERRPKGTTQPQDQQDKAIGDLSKFTDMSLDTLQELRMFDFYHRPVGYHDDMAVAFGEMTVLTFKSKEGQQSTDKKVRDIKKYLSNGGCLIVMIKVKADSNDEDIGAADNVPMMS